MAYYTYKNSKIQLNGESLFARQATVDFNSSISPQYKTDDRHTKKFAPEKGVGGTLSFNYLLTGSDFVKEFIFDEVSQISGSFGGLNFKSGYLTSYRFNATPASPVSVDANIAFFDDLKGSFSPTFEQAGSESLLNFSDAEISSLSSGIGDKDSIQRASFTYTSEIAPVYLAGEVTPREVRFGEKSVQAAIEIDTLSGDLSVFGNDARIQINLKDPKSLVVKESYFVDGKLSRKSMNVAANNPLSTALSVSQNYLTREPVISSYAPTVFKAGAIITIVGDRLHGTISVTFGGVKGKILSVSPTTITVEAPAGASVNFPILTVLGTDGSVSASTPYTFEFEPMTATLPSTTGEIGKQIRIGGTFFDRVSEIKFGPNNSQGARFEVIDSENILATIPNYADVGTISIISSEKEQEIKTSYFYPAPLVSGITPQVVTELGQTAVLKGASFSYTTSVQINDRAVGFYVADGSTMTLTVPNADIGGKVKVTDSKGNFGLSSFSVEQPPIITGFGPYPGVVDEAITISGTNFFATKFRENGDSAVHPHVSVYFEGGAELVTGVFGLVNATTITGIVPTQTRDGKVYLYRNDLNELHDSGLYLDVIEAAGTVTSIGMGNITIII